jgi:hypothetical protein
MRDGPLRFADAAGGPAPPEVCGCRKLDLPRIADTRGSLTVVEGGKHIPFDIGRVYWLYDVPGGESRDGHAHRRLEEVVIALSGSFDVVVDDGDSRAVLSLNRSYTGLYVPPGVWRHFEGFSTNAVCLVLASRPYSEDDYIRDYGEFLAER